MERTRHRACKEKQRCQDRGKSTARLRAELVECGAAQAEGCWAPQGFGVTAFPCFPHHFPSPGSALAICDFVDIRKELVPCNREVG